MSARRWTRGAVARSRVLATAVVVLVLAGVAGPGFAWAASGPTVSLSPASDVNNGQFIKVTWHGYDQFGAVEFRQCTLHPADVSTDCTVPYQDTGRSNGGGNGSLYQPVTLGDVPNVNWVDTDPTADTFRCDSETPCSIGVFPSGGALSSGVFATVHLAITADSCPTPTVTRALGGGESAVANAMARWSAVACQLPLNLPVGFSATDSYTGMTNFVDQISGGDFAATEVPPTGADKQKLSSQGRTVSFAPASASGLVLAYKIFARDPVNFQQGPQITDLRLTPDLIGQMFTGQIDNWNATAQINALNPKYEGLWPSIVRPEARADQAASTLEFTSWLTATAKKASLGPNWHGPTNIYKTDLLGTTQLWTGEAALARAIAQPVENDYFAYGYIGYVDSSTAAYFGLPVAQIKNAAGKYVAATPANVNAALSVASRDPQGFMHPSFRSRNPAAYPMPAVTYVMLPTNKVTSSAGNVLRDFVRYIATDGQSRKVLPLGYTPLNDKLRSQALAAADKVPHTNGSPTPSGGPSPSASGSSTSPSLTASGSASLFPPPGAEACASDTASGATPSATPSGSPSVSASVSASDSPSPPASPSHSPKPRSTRSPKASHTPTPSTSASSSDTPTPSVSASDTPSPTPSGSLTPSPSVTVTPAATPSVSCSAGSPAPFDAASFGGPSPKAAAAVLGLAVMGLAAGPILRILSSPSGTAWLRRMQEKINAVGWWRM